MKFVLLISIYTADRPAPYVHAFGTNLTGAQCIAFMERIYEVDPLFERGVPSCEFDAAELDQ